MQPIPPPPTGPNAPKTLPPRQTEATDARLAIRQHEDQPKRKKDQEHALDLTLPADVFDQAVLSVQAVIDFLQTFVKSQESTEAPADPPHRSGAGAQPTGSLSPGSHAARAYGHAAETAMPTKAAPLPPSASTLISNAEIRQIYRVLQKLLALRDRGIVAITLARAATFLDSLENAADQAS